MKKIHNGGIEGLVCKKKIIFTISSDCTIVITKMKF